MSSPSRALALLDLFSESRPVWHTDEMNEALGYTRATGYRYVRDLVEAGFLQKVSAGRYALGPRIIGLDYQLRRSDPVLLAAAPVMEDLVRRSRLDCVLTTMYGTQADAPGNRRRHELHQHAQRCRPGHFRQRQAQRHLARQRPAAAAGRRQPAATER